MTVRFVWVARSVSSFVRRPRLVRAVPQAVEGGLQRTLGGYPAFASSDAVLSDWKCKRDYMEARTRLAVSPELCNDLVSSDHRVGLMRTSRGLTSLRAPPLSSATLQPVLGQQPCQ